jgi:hypothetical protein
MACSFTTGKKTAHANNPAKLVHLWDASRPQAFNGRANGIGSALPPPPRIMSRQETRQLSKVLSRNMVQKRKKPGFSLGEFTNKNVFGALLCLLGISVPILLRELRVPMLARELIVDLRQCIAAADFGQFLPLWFLRTQKQLNCIATLRYV